MNKKKQREHFLGEIIDGVRALTDKVSSDEVFTRAPGRGLDGVSRPRPEERTHRVTGPGLLRQLVQALPPGSVDGGAGIRVKPGSRSPSASHIADTLNLIRSEASRLRVTMRQESGRIGSSPVPRTLSNDLLEIRSLSFALPDETVKHAAERVRKWVSRARVALTWDAPVVTLTEAPCPYCGGELKVRGDASSDVWCAGVPARRDLERQPPCRNEAGERRSWPRSSWLMLLERMTGQGGVDGGVEHDRAAHGAGV